MAEQQNRPASPEQAPDPSFNYERSHPEREAGAGALDHPTIGAATPAATPDKIAGAVTNAQDPTHSFTAQDEVPPQPAAGQRPVTHGMPAPEKADHSMLEEEPLGWDQAPKDIKDPEQQRHPRTGGEGGTPNVGQDELKS